MRQWEQGRPRLYMHFATNWGVKDAVGSPTFAIINEYQSAETGMIYHMDWYRLKNEEEARRGLVVEDCLYSGNLLFGGVAAQKAAGLLPEGIFAIHIEVLDANTRRLCHQYRSSLRNCVLNKVILVQESPLTRRDGETERFAEKYFILCVSPCLPASPVKKNACLINPVLWPHPNHLSPHLSVMKHWKKN